MGPAMTTLLVSGDRAAVGSPAQIPVLVIPAPLGTVGQVYTFQAGQDVAGTIGAGMGADQTLYLLRNTSGFVSVVIGAATWSSAPSLTHVGSGSALISLALASGAPGVYDDLSILFTVTVGGVNGAAQVSICYDGSTVAETVMVPLAPPAVLVGTLPITPSVLAELNGTTLVFAAPAVETLTFPAGSLAAVPAGLKAATATSLSAITWHASDLLALGVAALLANPRKLTLLSGGTEAQVPATAVFTGTDYTGTTISETVVPDTSAGSVSTTKAYASITSIVFAVGTGTAATIALGYLDAYASIAELVTQATAQAVAAPLAVTASISQNATGSFLAWTSTATGSGVSITLNASPGTLAALLGYANSQTASGAAAQYPLANTGLVATFPTTNPYILNDTFASGPITGPRMSISAITTAAQAAHDNYQNAPFGFVAVLQPADTPSNSQALDAALEVLRLAWIGDGTVPRDMYFITGGPWHTPSAVLATSDTNIATNDALVEAAFSNAAPTLGTVAHGDVYIPGAPTCRLGSFRRSGAIVATVKRAGAYFLAMDVGEGPIPEASLVGPDGVTRARNENRATVKMGGLDGPGFSVLRTLSDGKSVKFCPGATRAGATNRLRNIGDVATANEAARLIQAVVETWDAQRPVVDLTTGMISEGERGTRQGQVDAAVRPTLIPKTGKANVSGMTITIGDPPSGRFVDNGRVPVTLSYVVLGEVTQVNIVVALTGTSITSNPSTAAAPSS